MPKRIITAALWFAAGSYAGAYFALLAGASPLMQPALGAAAATIVLVVLWSRDRSMAPRTVRSEVANLSPQLTQRAPTGR